MDMSYGGPFYTITNSTFTEPTWWRHIYCGTLSLDTRYTSRTHMRV